VLVEDKETARNRLYDTAGEDDDSGLVPCRWRYHVLLVLGPRGSMTFEGKAVNWDRLLHLFARVPNRDQTVLCVAVTTEIYNNAGQREVLLDNALKRLKPLRDRYGFEYVSYIGTQKLRAKGGEPVLVAIQKDR